MQFSDETLMAYADDEVDADLRRQIEAAMALDPSLADRVAKHRSLRVDLGAAFDGVLDEPIPDRLLDAATSKTAPVTDLNAARVAKQRAAHPRRWSWVEWTSIAASLVIGILAGRTALQPSHSDLFATNPSGVVARGELAAALTDQMSGAPKGAQVRIGLTFRATSGEYCRTFATAAAAGFACREPNVWKVRALSESAADAKGGDYRMAATEMPPAILAAVEQSMAGEALDHDQEQAARARDWKK
ncbi:anti-sigma factor family protein [Steroidobacter flavus]|uniref:Anti-sigma factor family protein n=1 Tax=Steroidobacter flavus TaxID=1842136 RepID=A0ABV8SRC6_9GAMM